MKRANWLILLLMALIPFMVMAGGGQPQQEQDPEQQGLPPEQEVEEPHVEMEGEGIGGAVDHSLHFIEKAPLTRLLFLGGLILSAIGIWCYFKFHKRNTS